MSALARRGFSLLEVMVAIAILGLSLTVILSAQGGLAASNRSAANMGTAVALGRCKMTEAEEKLLKFGLPEIDAIDNAVSCCEDEDREGFKCDVRVEKIEMPNFTDGNSLGDGGALVSPGSPTGLPTNIAGGPGLDLSDGGLSGLGTNLASQVLPGAAGGSGPGAEGLLNMVMGILYPALKPMYEASIRRVTVNVKWKEGPNDRELPLVQYYTNPARGGFADQALLPDGGSLDSLSGAAPAGSAGSTTGTGDLAVYAHRHLHDHDGRHAMRKAKKKRASRGMTLLEILVSIGIMAMISLMIFGAFDSLSRGRKGESLRADRARQGRDAIDRITRELSSAYLSLHINPNQSLITRTTAFIATNSSGLDRVDFTTFAHRRIEREAKESDQAEIGYFTVKSTEADDKLDLVRREQAPPDLDPKRGGIVNVLCEDVESFDLKYLDSLTGQWVESWDTTQITGQPNRLPLEVRIILQLKEVKNTPAFRYSTKVMIPVQQPLSFGVAR